MTSNPWDAEHPVDAALATRLVHGQFPEFADREAVRVGQGWDNDVWRFGSMAFRFPRREFGVSAMGLEAAVLPALAERVPIPIPAPTLFGEPTEAFPYPWIGHVFVAGTTGDRAVLSAEQRIALAPAIGRFLRSLHDFDVEEAHGYGIPYDGPRGRTDKTAAWIIECSERLRGTPAEVYIPAIVDIASDPPDSSDEIDVLCHGDMYCRHILVDDQRRLSGVIDWGDVHTGDPARDLSIHISLIPPEGRAAFEDAYGPMDDGLKRRARLQALMYGVVLNAYGRDVGDRPLLAESVVLLENVLA